MKRAYLIVIVIAGTIAAGVAAHPRAAHGAQACHSTCAIHMTASPMPEMDSMSGMDDGMRGMGPHMTLTPKLASNAADAQRADEIVKTLRAAIAKYADYRVAERDGFLPFLANVPQPRYHFTNWSNAAAALATFDPTKPTSLLYEKTNDGYRLVGAMYTAPRSATLADLNARVPLAVAQWHEHVNLCKAPAGLGAAAYFGAQPQFGLAGSIATQDACEAAGGTFLPIIYNWMVHVYPFARTSADIWKIDMH